MAALVFWLGERLDAVNSQSCDCLLFEANGKGRERAVFPLGGLNRFRVVIFLTHFKALNKGTLNVSCWQ